MDTLNVTVYCVQKPSLKYIYLKFLDSKTLQLRAPYTLSRDEVTAFVESKSRWIHKKIHQLNVNILKKGNCFYLGQQKPLKSIQQINLDEFYKEESIHIILPLVKKLSAEMKLYPTEVKFRKNRRTWGSCSMNNSINFNIYLVKCPIEVIEYVVIHELAHIQHKNHSKQFWELVNVYCPNYKAYNQQLKTY